MGVSLAYVAVRGLPADTVLERLELARTGVPSDRAIVEELEAGALPGGWFLVQARGCDHRIIHPDTLTRLSAGCEALATSVEEHVNFAWAELWRDGQRLWQVSHDGSNEVDDWTAAGTPPPRVEELLATVSDDPEDLDGHDYFDIPLMLGRELTGYRFDVNDPVIDALPFERLADLRPAPTPWWRRWFSK